MAQMSIRVGGIYQTVKNIYVRVSGVYKSVNSGWVRVGGVWQQFYTSVVAPIDHNYSTANTYTETIPAGFTTLTIEAWGPTGLGAHGNTSGVGTQGGGGGSGGYSRSSYNISLNTGQTFTVVIPAGASGTATSVVNNSFTTSVNMTAPCGSNGAVGGASLGGAGGAAGAQGTGGTQATSPGNAGDYGDPNGGHPPADGLGGAAVVGIYATGPAGATGTYSNTVNNPGIAGVVNFHYS